MTKNLKDNTNMSIFEHLEELREKVFKALIFFIIITIICLLYNKNISVMLQQPAKGIKFLQLAPGEYFFSSIKIALYTGFILSSPFTIYQIMIFILPGLTKKESFFLIPTLISSIFLFFSGLIFAYNILVPAALKFLIEYGENIVEPIWSFEQYFNFIFLLLFSTGISFQIPIIQIILGITNVLSSKQMLKYWKYILFLSTILSAILTPSTDPLTQIFMSLAIIVLYLGGILILKSMNK
uniref:Sec-independent protein translocase component TatC n=1 Tax=Hypnea cornuta TaxID=105603 RepID=UPI0027D9F8AD|nr:Sec-independent protein translocase component TatC [Hypnea cornuta]YP_010903483.1 Sec-independent protein translocase component TatC [Hypnea cryptica]WCH55738.1 Sec-independent protein translocase component TatC [Hypnea cornuta]WCH55936.1 Sec-independent protein translocase component TatC [Hypnea cryptica]